MCDELDCVISLDAVRIPCQRQFHHHTQSCGMRAVRGADGTVCYLWHLEGGGEEDARVKYRLSGRKKEDERNKQRKERKKRYKGTNLFFFFLPFFVLLVSEEERKKERDEVVILFFYFLTPSTSATRLQCFRLSVATS